MNVVRAQTMLLGAILAVAQGSDAAPSGRCG
jgi:hypothetical protein